MDLKISTTPQQDDALARSNEDSNRGGEMPSLEDFVISLIAGRIDEEVLRWKKADVSDVATKLNLRAAELSAEDLAVIKVIVEK